MSRITINETYSTTPNPFTATDNVVLIPLCLQHAKVDATAASDADPTLMYTAVYDSASKFKSRYQNAVATYHDASASTSDKSVRDRSYDMAAALLDLGLKVVIKPIKAPARTGSNTYDYDDEATIISAVNTSISTNSIFEEFESRNLYNIKFITSGAYPNVIAGLKTVTSSETTTYDIEISGCYSTLASLANRRGDAVALVELSLNVKTGATGEITSATTEFNVLDVLQKLSTVSNASYCACTYPCGTYTANSTTLMLPGAYGYLTAYASSVQSNPNWYAAAGIQRGKVVGLSAAKYEVPESLADVLSGISSPSSGSINVCVNPITKLGNYGYRVYGNRTMDRISGSNQATQFLNVRMLVCDIKKQIYDAATRLTFEPNDDITFINFKTLVNVLLDKMRTGRGIDWYAWSGKTSTESGVITATLKLKPIEAVEQFNITIDLTDSDVTTSENSI